MNELVNKIKNDETQSRRASWQRYAELALKDDADKKTIDELKSLMAQLGRNADHFEEDARILHTVDSHIKTIGRGVGLSEKLQETNKAILDSNEALQAAIQELRIKHHKTVMEHSELAERFSAAVHSAQALNELKQKHADLLAHIPEYSRVTCEPLGENDTQG